MLLRVDDFCLTRVQTLATWKRSQDERETAQRQAVKAISDDERAGLDDRGISTDPADYDDVPSGAYITIKTTKQTRPYVESSLAYFT
ncbi:hypothetical protein ACFPYI_21710 [Halomarina salina]|uniref:Uncharacterized protein n=1 Tax=Halomarina salina TaxID=1872699 RepID=A0ABD5RU44_9EURY|nr:hypothetical protein [Halomarina salina]